MSNVIQSQSINIEAFCPPEWQFWPFLPRFCYFQDHKEWLLLACHPHTLSHGKAREERANKRKKVLRLDFLVYVPMGPSDGVHHRKTKEGSSLVTQGPVHTRPTEVTSWNNNIWTKRPLIFHFVSWSWFQSLFRESWMLLVGHAWSVEFTCGKQTWN